MCFGITRIRAIQNCFQKKKIVHVIIPKNALENYLFIVVFGQNSNFEQKRVILIFILINLLMISCLLEECSKITSSSAFQNWRQNKLLFFVSYLKVDFKNIKFQVFLSILTKKVVLEKVVFFFIFILIYLLMMLH